MKEAGFAVCSYILDTVGLLITISIPIEISSRTPNALKGGSVLLYDCYFPLREFWIS